jgi:hypothetical protein
MSKKMAGIIMACGVVLAVLGLIVRSVTPQQGKVAFITGLAGGGLFLLCGVAALAGHKRRVWTILSGAGIIFVVLSQTVQAWIERASVSGALLMTLMLLVAMGMQMYVVHGERPPEFYKTGTGPIDKSHSRGN